MPSLSILLAGKLLAARAALELGMLLPFKESFVYGFSFCET